MLRFVAFTVVSALSAAPAAVSVRCPSGALVSSLELRVAPPAGGEARRLREVNVIAAGSQLWYAPGRLPVEKPGKARVALVIVPSDTGQSMEVTELRRADQPASWKIKSRASVVGLVFGPQGLNYKKVRRLVGSDTDLMMQLAEYAEKSTQAENLLHALTAYDRQARSRQNLEAALAGFASAWRLPTSRLDNSAPLDQQAAVLLRTLNPALSSFDPLAPQGTTRFEQTAGLAASVAGLFWGNTVGLAAGSTALFLNLRTMLFPNADFRTSFAQSSQDQLVLCAPRETQKPRTQPAYLWAVKIPNLEPPRLALAGPVHVACGIRNEVPLKSTDLESQFLLRARDWRLVRTGGKEDLAVRVLPAAASGKLSALQLDLGGTTVPPGEYRLHYRWDWTDSPVEGTVQVHQIERLESAHLTPESQDRLVTGGGPVMVELTGADFQFLEKATLRNPNDPSSRTTALELLRTPPANPDSKRAARIVIDTSTLAAGDYALILQQAGGQLSEVPIRVLPPAPVLEGLPLRVNLGEAEQVIALRGRGLDRLEAAAADGASLALLDRNDTVRKLRVRLPAGVSKGKRIPVRLKVEGVHAELTVKDVLQVAGPRPRILGVTASPPAENAAEVRDGELVAGMPRSFSVRTAGLDRTAKVHIACQDAAQALAPVSVRTGEEQPGAEVQAIGRDMLFLSLEPGRIGSPDCQLTLSVETDGQGASDPQPLGTVIRLPRIESFELTEEKTADGLYVATLEGRELDTIEKTGWSREEGFAALGLPAPVPGKPQRQTLRVALPWPAPSPRAPLYVFLHKETVGRLTKAHL